jgi:divalent metal cation (Fe/Co/Zn/Cd) transporter
MAGILVAAVGLFISQQTGDPRFDGAASIVIGLILAITAFVLAYESKALLIGEAADPELVEALRRLVATHSGITAVGDILTVHSSPDQVTAMLSVDFDDGISARDVERIVCEVEEEAARTHPLVRRLFIRPRSPVTRHEPKD